MIEARNTFSTVIVALAVASAVHADMMPMSTLDSGYRQSLPICDGTVPQRLSDSGRFALFSGAIDLDLLPVGSLPAMRPDAGDAGEAKPPQLLTDKQSSFNLCLYALMGLGLCRTAPWVKKVHIGLVPDWYHTRGPYQIGHSFAISPDCLISVPALCFVQPDGRPGEDPLVRYRWGVVTSLWRKSQFTPTTLASRGPPRMS